MANVQYLLPDEQSRTAATVNAVMTVNHLINTHTTTTTTTINNTMSSIETMNSFDNNNNGQDRPCEKYRQFIDSSVQERTFMIGKLVETFANTIDSIWNPKFLADKHQVKVIPTLGFCNEILKRSKATYSTLQISLFYIFRVKKVVHEKLYQRAQLPKDMQTSTNQEDLMCCGRRMFLASLMVASKYLHDKNYHNKAWAKITGLDIKEINAAEMAFLTLIDYQLYVSKPTFDRWYTQIHGYIQNSYKSATPQAREKAVVVQSTVKDQQNITCAYPSGAGAGAAAAARTVISCTTDYPSPPPDPLAATTTTIAASTDKCFQRNDSGVSFDIMSPPITATGTKRQFNAEDSTNKRSCH